MYKRKKHKSTHERTNVRTESVEGPLGWLPSLRGVTDNDDAKTHYPVFGRVIMASNAGPITQTNHAAPCRMCN